MSAIKSQLLAKINAVSKRSLPVLPLNPRKNVIINCATQENNHILIRYRCNHTQVIYEGKSNLNEPLSPVRQNGKLCVVGQ